MNLIRVSSSTLTPSNESAMRRAAASQLRLCCWWCHATFSTRAVGRTGCGDARMGDSAPNAERGNSAEAAVTWSAAVVSPTRTSASTTCLITSTSTPERRVELRERQRPDGRTRDAAHLQRQADEDELMHARCRELFEIQVLDDRDAGPDQKQQVARQADAKLLVEALHGVE